MRGETYPLNVPATATPGLPQMCHDLLDKWVEVTGIAGGGALQIEGSVNGSNWTISNAGSLTADGMFEIPEAFRYIRVNRTVLGSGTPAVLLAARQGRSD